MLLLLGGITGAVLGWGSRHRSGVARRRNQTDPGAGRAPGGVEERPSHFAGQGDLQGAWEHVDPHGELPHGSGVGVTRAVAGFERLAILRQPKGRFLYEVTGKQSGTGSGGSVTLRGGRHDPRRRSRAQTIGDADLGRRRRRRAHAAGCRHRVH